MPWLSLQPMLAKASKDRNDAKVIKYKHFLARYQVLMCTPSIMQRALFNT
jgi:hypothetical protein